MIITASTDELLFPAAINNNNNNNILTTRVKVFNQFPLFIFIT